MTRRNNHGLLLAASLLGLGLFGEAENSQADCSGSSPTWICSAESTAEQIQACVDGAAADDRINIAAGNGTWSSQVTITRAISIVGAGQGATVIDNGFSAACSGQSDPSLYLIAIIPADPADNPAVQIGHMSFNFDTASSCGIYFANESVDSDLTKVRLHHLDMMESGFVFVRRGLAHGLMDSCNIKGSMDIAGTVGLWGADNSVAAYEFGNASNFYFEDNVWTPYSQSESFFQAGNGDGRYAFRYNTITLPDATMTSPLFDLHGNQSSADSGFGAELYGNSVTAPYNGPQHFYAQRGGKSLVFDNFVLMAFSGATSTWAIEEHLDSEASFPTQAYNGQPQHVSDSYYWSNYRNSEILNPSSDTTLSYSDLGRDVPLANFDVWLYTESFDGSSGVGCGPIAARPASCTTGAGYWATDQSCSDLAAMTGAGPSTPISGTLYRCTAPDTWAAYYTPYPYPHPLRTDCVRYPTLCDPGTARPRAPAGLTVI